MGNRPSISKFLVFMILSLSVSYVAASVYNVGPGLTYTSPNALYTADVINDADTIIIASGDYIGTAALAVWQQDDLLIQGADASDRPHMIAAGQYIWGKGIWVFAGDNITVENIEFSGASVPDQNGAGIRLDGIGMTARNCYFHDNEDGILTSNPEDGDILIEYCEFANNGFGDGQSHNVYIGRVNKLTFRYNYSHHAIIGHNLKSRAKENIILYNRIMDEESGNSSRLIDLSNGGATVIMGNLLMQGPNAPNNNLIGYGLEGLTVGVSHEIHLVNNTLINKRLASGLFIDARNGAEVLRIQNNIFGGTGTLLNGTAIIQSNNIIESDIATIGLVDEAMYNYNLMQSSTAVNQGLDLSNTSVLNTPLEPFWQYVHTSMSESRQVNATAIDIGAYEYGLISASELVVEEDGVSIYPNPTQDDLNIVVESGNYTLNIYDSSSNQILAQSLQSSMILDLAPYASGVYYLELININNRQICLRTILKY